MLLSVSASVSLLLLYLYLVALQQRYGPQGLQIVGLNVGGEDDYEQIPVYAREFSIQYPLGFPDDDFADQYLSDNQNIPQSFLFDRNGTLVQRFIGYDEGAGAELSGCDPITKDLYSDAEKAALPEKAVAASLGCGNPTALAKLQPGETVLDLGSGGGIDVILSAKRVGPTGKAYGLDMTDEMLALARENQKKAGVENAEFLKGAIENVPLPDNSVDVIISNCVINLSGDKDRVISEAFRVLKPGGRFAVSDVVLRGDVPADIRKGMELWVGCIAGALEENEYRQKLARAGRGSLRISRSRRTRPGKCRPRGRGQVH